MYLSCLYKLDSRHHTHHMRILDHAWALSYSFKLLCLRIVTLLKIANLLLTDRLVLVGRGIDHVE